MYYANFGNEAQDLIVGCNKFTQTLCSVFNEKGKHETRQIVTFDTN